MKLETEKLRPLLQKNVQKDIVAHTHLFIIELIIIHRCLVDTARVRVLDIAKRQLHKRMRILSAHNTLVTFGILIHGFPLEVYIARYVDGYYPYEKTTWGELPRFNKANGVLTHALRSMLTLKHWMELSLADIDTNDNNPDGLTESNLLPTVSHTMIYKEAANDRATDSNNRSV